MKNLFLGFGLVAVGIVAIIIIAIVTFYVYRYFRDKESKGNITPSDDPLCWHCDSPISNDAIFCDNCGGKHVKPKYKEPKKESEQDQDSYVWH